MRTRGISIHNAAGMARLQRAYDAQTPYDDDGDPCPCWCCSNWENGVCYITREDEDGNEYTEETNTDRYDTCDDVDPKESEY